MTPREYGYVPPEAQELKGPEKHATPDFVRRKVDWVLGKIFNKFTVEGKEALIKEQKANPDGKYIIAGSHFSGHDVQATIKALGDVLDIQVTGETLVQDMANVKFMINQIGRDRFSPIEYKNVGGEHRGVFRPEDFNPIADKIEQGRTPWMAIHPFSMSEEMRDSGVGAVYLAHKTGSKIIPTTVHVEGASTRFITPIDYLKQLAGKVTGKAKLTYRVGEPVALPELDVSIVERVMAKRAARKDGGDAVTAAERKQFLETTKQLRAEAEMIAKLIAQMAPEKNRGVYQPKEESTA